MLALLTAWPARAAAPTLVFDEVDAGIGGQTARAVGERLRALAEGRQVLCITHLPQIASLAARHFRIEKAADGRSGPHDRGGARRATRWSASCAGCSAPTTCDAGARRHAEELLAAA